MERWLEQITETPFDGCQEQGVTVEESSSHIATESFNNNRKKSAIWRNLRLIVTLTEAIEQLFDVNDQTIRNRFANQFSHRYTAPSRGIESRRTKSSWP